MLLGGIMHVTSRKAAGKEASSPRFDVIAYVISSRCDHFDFQSIPYPALHISMFR